MSIPYTIDALKRTTRYMKIQLNTNRFYDLSVSIESIEIYTEELENKIKHMQTTIDSMTKKSQLYK